MRLNWEIIITKKILKEKEEAIYNQDFEKAAKLRDDENEARERYEGEINKWKKRKNKANPEIRPHQKKYRDKLN